MGEQMTRTTLLFGLSTLFLAQAHAASIFLYPPKETPVTAKLRYQGDLRELYPPLDAALDVWNLIVYPDGRILNRPEQREYSFLYWDGDVLGPTADFSTGFVVSAEKLRPFLRKSLTRLGLNSREVNDFLINWWGPMKDNAYNLIHFVAQEDYPEAPEVEIIPEPDTVIKVFMIYRPLTKPIKIAPQTLTAPARNGFTVVEHGGMLE
jgi:hypothetical protein